MTAAAQPSLRIRPAADGDEAALVALWKAVGVYRPWNDPARDIAFARRGPHSTVLVAEEGGRILASAMIGEDGHRGWVYYLAVEPDRQGSGLGRSMMAAAEDWLRRRGVWKVQLLVRRDNEAVRDFYRALGYSEPDTLLMQKVVEPVAPEPADAAFARPIGFGREARAAFASEPAATRGRLVPERESPTRTPFQRDRDRIVHSTAFRRLAHKTQVFVYHEGDHFRTRLTHTIEVAQIARALARALRLDEDLAEALALGHDLGHTPFGHAGERALNRAMAGHGGFDHNAQTLRIVTSLERRYAGFDGLNLSWEALEGLVKHNGPLTDQEGRALGHTDPEGVAHPAVLPYAIDVYREKQDLWLWSWPSAEAQVAALADDIAYDAHDIDDGLRAGLIVPDQLADVPLAGPVLAEVRRAHPRLDLARTIQEVTRRLITRMVEDVIGESLSRLAEADPRDADAVRRLGRPVAAFSDEIAAADRGIKAFLYANVYRAASVNRVMGDAERVVEDLFGRYMADPAEMPGGWHEDLAPGDRSRRARRVADYIAGMTDRLALVEHRRLFDATPELR